MPREIRKSKHPSLRPSVHQLTREIAARNRNQTRRTWKRRVPRTFHISGVQKKSDKGKTSRGLSRTLFLHVQPSRLDFVTCPIR